MYAAFMHYIAAMMTRGLLLAGLLAAGPVRAETVRPPRGPLGERVLTIVNNSDRAVNEIYVSPSSADAWGEDRLGEATLAPGDSIRLRLGRTRECAFDVQVIYEDASRELQLGQNLCRDKQLAFTGANAQLPQAVLEAQHQVVLHNGSGRAIQQVFISPAEATQWGDDLLPHSSVSVGESVTVTYQGACAADLRVVFDNRAAEERRGLDLCENPAINIKPGWTTADQVPTVAPQGVRLTNESGHAVLEFALRPEAGDGAAHDLLGAVALANGETLQLPFGRNGGCRFDAHVEFDGGAPAREIAGLDLCANPVITLRP
jgi:hypothetical protein